MRKVLAWLMILGGCTIGTIAIAYIVVSRRAGKQPEARAPVGRGR